MHRNIQLPQGKCLPHPARSIAALSCRRRSILHCSIGRDVDNKSLSNGAFWRANHRYTAYGLYICSIFSFAELQI